MGRTDLQYVYQHEWVSVGVFECLFQGLYYDPLGPGYLCDVFPISHILHECPFECQPVCWCQEVSLSNSSALFRGLQLYDTADMHRLSLERDDNTRLNLQASGTETMNRRL